MSSDHRAGSLLIVTAHPADAELWAGGTLLVHARSARTDIAVELAEPDQLAEAQAAASLLGTALHSLPAATPAGCADLLRRLRPQVLVIHDPEDPDDGHRRTAGALLGALRHLDPSHLPHRLYRCRISRRASPDLAGPGTRIVNVDDTYQQKLRALAAYQSLASSGRAALADQRSRAWGDRIGVERAEAFVPLPILGRLPAATHL